jgi:hypothetical protein
MKSTLVEGRCLISFRCQVETVQMGHLNISQEQVDVDGSCSDQGIHAIPCFDDSEA